MPVVLLPVLIALNGLDYINLGDPFRHGKIRYSLLLLVPVVFEFFRRRLHWAPAFVGAMALASWVLHDFKILAELPLIEILGCLSLACFIVRYPSKNFATILILSGCFQAVVSLLQWQGIHPWAVPAEKKDWFEMVGTYGHRTVLGPFLVACLAPALWERRWAAALLILVTISMLHSTMTFAALGTLFLVWAWRFMSPLWSILLGYFGAIGLGIALYLAPHFSGFDPDGRLYMWSAGLEAVKECPLFGSGIGGWAQVHLPKYGPGLLKAFGDTIPVQLHSDPLDYAVEFGLPALAVLLAAFAQFVWRFRATWCHAACAALLVNSLGNFPFAIISIALVFVICFTFSMRDDYA